MIESLKRGGTRKVNMLLFGATIGRTRYPLFLLNNKYKILPRQFPFLSTMPTVLMQISDGK